MITDSAFSDLSKKLKAQGAKDPDALAAYIGRKKYGKAKFQKMAAAGRKESEVMDDLIDQVLEGANPDEVLRTSLDEENY